MKYTFAPVSVIHWDLTKDAVKHLDSTVKTELFPTPNGSPSNQKCVYNFSIRWTFRIASKSKQQIFSYISEQKFLIIFIKSPNNYQNLNELFKLSLNNSRHEFNNRKKGTVLESFEMDEFKMPDENLKNILHVFEEQCP